MIRDEVSYFFSKYVKNFHTTTNGQEGLELYNQIKPDLINYRYQIPKNEWFGYDKKRLTIKKSYNHTTAFSDIDYFFKKLLNLMLINL